MFYGLGIVLGVLALVCEMKTRNRVERNEAPLSSLDLAKAGKICGWIGISISTLTLVIFGILIIDVMRNGVY